MYTARIKLPAALSEFNIENIEKTLSEALAGQVSAFSAFREKNNNNAPWILQLITPQQPEETFLAMALTHVPNIAGPPLTEWFIEKVPEIDWLAHSYRQFPPFSVGEFFIYGSHYEGAIPETQIGLQIDAATAFGSGEHGTTSGCLSAMLDLKEAGICPWNVLDMGTGSGILAIAAWKLWKTPVLAIDNDKEAVRVACHHRMVNKVPADSTGMICKAGDGFATKQVQDRKPFDLIIANILAGPLKDMAEVLKAVSDENGYIILSGILNTQADGVLSAYKNHGFKMIRVYERGDWSTLVLHHPPV